MSTSLHTRLLLSYGLLIAVLMCLISAGTFASLLRNPLIYENAAQQLRTAQRKVNNNIELLESIPANQYAPRASQAARLLGARVVLVHSNGEILADSQAGTDPLLRIQPVRIKALAQRNEIGYLRDETNRLWLALVQVVDDQTSLVLVVRRPLLAILEIFNSEFFRPVIMTGLAGLVLAVVIALMMTHWISAPLRRIGAAVNEVADGKFHTIPPAGPAEVRHLATTFNRMIQRVQDAQQSQRDLVANVSHELKTPLTSIQGFTQAILDGVAQTPDEIQQAARIISIESHRMNRLVQDLVSLARLEAGTADLHHSAVDMGGLVRGIAEKFRPQVDQAGLQLNLDLPELPWLVGDEDHLAQVFSNLVDNAIKYTPAGGVICVSAQHNNDNVEIRISDTGSGIRPADTEHIFERFFQADPSRSGMGLGLAITRQIVLAHKGTIRVEKHSPQGSVFIVTLPSR